MGSSSPSSASAASQLAQALHDAGAVVTFVPGFGATQVFDAYAALAPAPPVVSFHEEVAFTVAHGAALAGRRAVALLKTHGLAKAANSALDAVVAGTTAAFVPILFDDPQGRHSDSVADPVRLLEGLQLPFRRAGAEGLRAALYACFEASERAQLPCALVVEADAMPLPVPPAAPTVPPGPPPVYRRDVARHVLCPPFAAYQHQVLLARLGGRDAEALPRPAVPDLPAGLPAPWRPALAVYVPFFDVFSRVRRGPAAGDAGLSSLFAFPPFDAVDVTTYMGGSVPLAIGACLAGAPLAWALTGDFSFVAAGHLGLLEAVLRDVPVKVAVFANGRAEATGGQPVDAVLLDRLLAGYAARVHRLDDVRDPAVVEATLAAAAEADGLRIVVVDLALSTAARPTR